MQHFLLIKKTAGVGLRWLLVLGATALAISCKSPLDADTARRMHYDHPPTASYSVPVQSLAIEVFEYNTQWNSVKIDTAIRIDTSTEPGAIKCTLRLRRPDNLSRDSIPFIEEIHFRFDRLSLNEGLLVINGRPENGEGLSFTLGDPTSTPGSIDYRTLYCNEGEKSVMAKLEIRKETVMKKIVLRLTAKIPARFHQQQMVIPLEATVTMTY